MAVPALVLARTGNAGCIFRMARSRWRRSRGAPQPSSAKSSCSGSKALSGRCVTSKCLRGEWLADHRCFRAWRWFSLQLEPKQRKSKMVVRFRCMSVIQRREDAYHAWPPTQMTAYHSLAFWLSPDRRPAVRRVTCKVALKSACCKPARPGSGGVPWHAAQRAPVICPCRCRAARRKAPGPSRRSRGCTRRGLVSSVAPSIWLALAAPGSPTHIAELLLVAQQRPADLLCRFRRTR